MTKIASQWDSYALDVIPLNALRVQRFESRRAFYAGAAAVLHLLWELSADDVSVDTGAASIETIIQECALFKQDVLEGKA
jgi:hypothetical protein